MKKQSAGVGALLFISAFAVASCAAPGIQANVQPATPAPSSSEATASPSQTSAATESAGSKASPGSQSSSGASSAADNKPAETVATEKAGSPLSLADFFRPTREWTENRFDVADKSDVSGMSAEVSTTSEENAATLELRLANNFNELSFRVGQANNSTSSEQTLIVKVLGNGKQLDVFRVPFNTVQDVSVPIKGVNAVKVRLYLDGEKRREQGSVLAVMSNVTAK